MRRRLRHGQLTDQQMADLLAEALAAGGSASYDRMGVINRHLGLYGVDAIEAIRARRRLRGALPPSR